MYKRNLKSVALPFPEIIAIEVLGVAIGSRRGSGMVPFERASVSSYRFSIVTFPMSLRVSDIHCLKKRDPNIID